MTLQSRDGTDLVGDVTRIELSRQVLPGTFFALPNEPVNVPQGERVARYPTPGVTVWMHPVDYDRLTQKYGPEHPFCKIEVTRNE